MTELRRDELIAERLEPRVKVFQQTPVVRPQSCWRWAGSMAAPIAVATWD